MSIKDALEYADRARDTLLANADVIPPGEQAITFACLAQVYATLSAAAVISGQLAALSGTGKGDAGAELAGALEEFGADSALLAHQMQRFAGRHDDDPS